MNKSENLKQFLSYCLCDIRKNELICGLLPLGLFSYFLLPQISGIFVILFLIDVIFSVALISMVVKRRSKIKHGKKLDNYPTSELYKIIKEIDCKPTKNPIVIVSGDNIYAYTTLDKKIKLEKGFLEKLENDEIGFVLGHESFHYCSRDIFYFLISLPVLAMPFIILGLVSYFITLSIAPASFGNTPTEIQPFVCIGIALVIYFPTLILLVALMLRGIESMADKQGVNYSNKNAAISALNKVYEGKKPHFFGSHPKLEIRRDNINKMPNLDSNFTQGVSGN